MVSDSFSHSSKNLRTSGMAARISDFGLPLVMKKFIAKLDTLCINIFEMAS
jgi:hypothetical protein